MSSASHVSATTQTGPRLLKPRRVLVCGAEKVLCETRQALLEYEGYVAALALNVPDFVAHKGTSHPPWGLFIISHTLIDSEHEAFERLVETTADIEGVAVYRILQMVQPAEFLCIVKSVLRGHIDSIE